MKESVIKKFLDAFIQKMPYIGRWRSTYLKHSTPGEYSSPIPDIEYLLRNKEKFFQKSILKLNAINLNIDCQMENLKLLMKYKNSFDFPFKKSKEFRYYLDNIYYRQFDAFFLFSMLLHFRPENVIEIGSGYSSALMLDTNEKFLDHKIRFTFIDPDTRRLRSLLKLSDNSDNNVVNIEKSVMDVDSSIFNTLKENDILFIDSSHVCKAGSELNYLIFEILPILNNGVLIHFHDIFYPFEYPIEILINKFYWNEIYFLRSFLMYNETFEIFLMNKLLIQYLKINHDIAPEIKKFLEKMDDNLAGSIWLRKVK